MGALPEKYRDARGGEIVSLNIDDLDVVELERRLEMAVALGATLDCAKFCDCPHLATCGTFCT